MRNLFKQDNALNSTKLYYTKALVLTFMEFTQMTLMQNSIIFISLS